MIDNIDKFIDDYIKWLKSNITTYKFNNNVAEITLPFLNQINDYIQIYLIKGSNNQYILSDDGETINNLKMSGINLDTNSRAKILDKILKSYGAFIDNDAINIKFSEMNLPQSLNAMIQAMHSVSDMFMLSRSTTKSIFIEDVEIFLNNNDIYPIRDASFTGSSGLLHKIDFSIQATKNSNQKYINTVNKLDKYSAQLELFKSVELKESKNDIFDYVVIYNDTDNSVSDDNLNALYNYGIKPIAWSNKDKSLSYFKGVA